MRIVAWGKPKQAPHSCGHCTCLSVICHLSSAVCHTLSKLLTMQQLTAVIIHGIAQGILSLQTWKIRGGGGTQVGVLWRYNWCDFRDLTNSPTLKWSKVLLDNHLQACKAGKVIIIYAPMSLPIDPSSWCSWGIYHALKMESFCHLSHKDNTKLQMYTNNTWHKTNSKLCLLKHTPHDCETVMCSGLY